MDERILDELENVPSNVADAFKELKELCYSRANIYGISKEEKDR